MIVNRISKMQYLSSKGRNLYCTCTSTQDDKRKEPYQMRIRVRFPDGQSAVVPGLRAHVTFAELLTAIAGASGRSDLSDAKLTRVNAPGQSERIEIGAHGSCKPYPADGDTLRVEPATPVVTAPTRARGRGRGRGRTMRNPRDGIASVASLGRRNVKRAQRDNDVTWAPDLADAEPAVARKRSRRGRGMVLGDGNSQSRPPVPKKKKRPALGGEALLIAGQVTGELGTQLAAAASGDNQRGGAQMRNVLTTALTEREAEAAGERRHAAALGRTYTFTNLVDGVFEVRFRSRVDPGWTTEGPLPDLPRAVLAASFRMALEDVQGARERMRAREMARVSPRVFWNMVKLFPESVEDGLRELVPDADWSFLTTRRRELSAKAKRNLSNAHVGRGDE